MNFFKRSLILEKRLIFGLVCSHLFSPSYAMEEPETKEGLAKFQHHFRVVENIAAAPQDRRHGMISKDEAIAVESVRRKVMDALSSSKKEIDKECRLKLILHPVYQSRTIQKRNPFVVADTIMAWSKEVLAEETASLADKRANLEEKRISPEKIDSTNPEQEQLPDPFSPIIFPFKDENLIPEEELFMLSLSDKKETSHWDYYQADFEGKADVINTTAFARKQYVQGGGEEQDLSPPPLPSRDETLTLSGEPPFLSDNEDLPPPLPSRDEETLLFGSCQSNLSNPEDSSQPIEGFVDPMECPPPPPPLQAAGHWPKTPSSTLRDKGEKLKSVSSETVTKQSEDSFAESETKQSEDLYSLLYLKIISRGKSLNPDGDGEG